MGSVCGKKSPAPVETDKAPRQSYRESEAAKEPSATNSKASNNEAAAPEVAAPEVVAEAEGEAEEEAAPAEDE